MFDPRTARILTLVLFACGALFAGIGGGLYVRAWRTAEGIEEGRARAEVACAAGLRGLGEIVRTAEGLRLIVPNVNDPRSRLSDASAVLATCPGWTLSYLCMGLACGQGSNVTLIIDLRYHGATATAAPST